MGEGLGSMGVDSVGLGSESDDEEDHGQMGEDDDAFHFLVLLDLVGTPNS